MFMAINDSFVVSFKTKYRYNFWRPETAIRAGDSDGNDKTDGDAGFTTFFGTPCFPAYPSNHASGSNSAAEILRRIYGAGEHAITLTNPAVPAIAGITLQYTDPEPDLRRHRRCPDLRRHPLPLRSGRGRARRTGRRNVRLQEHAAGGERPRITGSARRWGEAGVFRLR